MAKRPGKPVQFGRWIVDEVIGRAGANSIVYRATKDGVSGAVKVLRSPSRSRYARFQREIEAMKLYQDIPGILPLLDSYCPPVPTSKELPWLVMALAQPIKEAFGPEPPLREVILACADIADTLSEVHERGGSHRDVKPDNLFKYRERFAVGDFGLVEFPGQTSLTVSGEKLGPVYYIAPEMLNNAEAADGRPADVFSLAKTLWVLATSQRFPLPGQLSSTTEATTLSAYVPDIHARLLDRLLEEATALEALRRPSMRTMATELRAWLAPPLAIKEHPMDLSVFSREIEAINQPHYVKEQQTLAEHTRMNRDGIRIRERFRPILEEVGEALRQAKFIGVEVEIHNYDYDFSAKGFMMAGGQIRLKLDGFVRVPGVNEVGEIRVDCSYTIVTLDSATPEQKLWEGQARFIPEGSSEDRELQRLMIEIQENLLPSVRRMLEICREKPAQPR
jgi:serine/threonine protein kinase